MAETGKFEEESLPSGESLSSTVRDSWRASLAPSTPAGASVRPLSPRAPSARSTTVARRVVRPAAAASGADVDFAIEHLIGSGGMGMIYQAAQTSLNRKVALKALPEENAGLPDWRENLREEALITGQLDHPNIIPVYDLATDEQGRLFYTMKQVRGHAWSSILPRQPLDERLDVFLRVCDAVAFAHSRDVIHRDLKPSNVMVGAFGEVTLMDWGVACTVRGMADPHALGDRSARCGTPAYMPPEMARGDWWNVGPASDVYLLGAMLYELLEDRPPRVETDAMACILQASDNVIVPPARDDELSRVAMKAMATVPAQRYATVPDLQAAVRGCRLHMESIRLVRSAEDMLSAAGDSYESHAEAIFGFREAGRLWPEHTAAAEGLARARLAFARTARRKGDFELALSQLDPTDPAHASERAGIESDHAAQQAHRRRFRLFARATAGLATALTLGIAVFGWVVKGKNTLLERQKSTIEIQSRENREAYHANLISLFREYHTAGKHEAAVAALHQLQAEFGTEWCTNPELRDMARVSLWMNPWRATADTGLSHPKRLIYVPATTSLVVVSESHLAVADPVSLDIRQRLALPSAASDPYGGTVEADPRGTLWCMRGSRLYRLRGTQWTPEPREIPEQALGKEEIRGFIPPTPDSPLIAAVGPHRLIRLSENGTVREAVHPPGDGPIARGSSENLLRKSPDGQWLIWRPSRVYAWVYLIRAETMEIQGRIFNRGFPFRRIEFSSDSSRVLLSTRNGTLAAPLITDIIQRSSVEPQNVILELYARTWQAPLPYPSDCAWAPNRCDLALGDEEGRLWLGTAFEGKGWQQNTWITHQDPKDMAMDDHGQVFILSTNGQIHRYDLRAFARQALPRSTPAVLPNRPHSFRADPALRIPAPDVVGAPSYWTPSNAGIFRRYSATNQPLSRNDYWTRFDGLDRRFEFSPRGMFSAFWLPAWRRLILAWNGDLLPISTNLTQADSCSALEFSPDGSFLILTHEDGSQTQITLPTPEDALRLAPELEALLGDAPANPAQ